MRNHSRFTKVGLLFAAGSFVAALNPVLAASGPAATAGYEAADPRLQRYGRMGELMEQMQEEMGAMSKRVADPKLTAQERKTMGEDMKRMASMMRRMSGLVDRPSMKDAEARKQMDDMAKQMSAMQKHHQPGAAK